MKQLQGWSMVLALSLAGAVLAQTQRKPETTQPDSATTSTSPTEGTAADSTPPGEKAPGDAARIAATGDAKVSAHRASKAGARSGLVSVPWSMASSMIEGSAFVMEQARLDEAPSFEETT